jgi:hypothetical protein
MRASAKRRFILVSLRPAELPTARHKAMKTIYKRYSYYTYHFVCYFHRIAVDKRASGPDRKNEVKLCPDAKLSDRLCIAGPIGLSTGLI